MLLAAKMSEHAFFLRLCADGAIDYSLHVDFFKMSDGVLNVVICALCSDMLNSHSSFRQVLGGQHH